MEEHENQRLQFLMYNYSSLEGRAVKQLFCKEVKQSKLQSGLEKGRKERRKERGDCNKGPSSTQSNSVCISLFNTKFAK